MENKDKFDELLEKLQGLDLIQGYIYWAYCIPQDIWDEYFQDNFLPVTKGIEIERHRWYDTTIEVVSICGHLLGVRSVTRLYSEESDVEDMQHTLEFFEMKPVQTTTYVKIEKIEQ